MKHQWLSITLSACLLIPVCGCQQQASEDPTVALTQQVLEVDVVPVERNAIESSVELTGTLYPWKFATVASEVTGVIASVRDSGEELHYELHGKEYHKKLPLDIGHRVTKGDELITIQSSEYEKALAVAQARLKLAEMQLANLFAWKRTEEVDQIEAQCDEADALLVDAEADLKRNETLVATKAASRKALEDARRAVATAQAAKKRAEAALALAKAGPTKEEIEVAKAQLELARAEVATQQDKLSKCQITCPLDRAWVVERYVGVGDHVTANPSTSLIRLVDSTVLLAQVHVPERYQGLIDVHDRAVLTVQGGRAGRMTQDTVEGMVVLVNAAIDPDTRTFRVRVGVDNSQGVFKPGTFVKVRIPLDTRQAIVVPTDAITFTEGKPSVFVVRDGVVDQVPVQLGISNRNQYQVVSGLSENDLVVKGGLSLLAPGLRVRARTAVADVTHAEKRTSIAAPSQG